jgi:hypothetical protein
MQHRGKLSYTIAGNAHAKRARVVRCYTAEGPKDLVVPAAGSVKPIMESIDVLGPSRIEAYEDDPPTRMLRALDLVEEEAETAAVEFEEPTQTRVTREERLLSHFATLLAKAYADSHTAFKQLVRIAEHHANRAAIFERQAAQAHAAMIKQSQQILRSQAAQLGAEDDDAESGGIGALIKSFMSAHANGAAAPHANGAAPKAPKEPS